MTQISLRVDDKVKELAEQTCSDIGISLSAAITIFLKKMGRERRIPFDVSVDPFYSEENMARLRSAIAKVESGASTMKEHDLIEVDE